MPVSLPVDAASMNYASVVFAGFAAISVAWYIAYARKHFTGPPVPVDQLRDTPGVVPVKAVVDPEQAGSKEVSTEKS
jgi:hypothetical protein